MSETTPKDLLIILCEFLAGNKAHHEQLYMSSSKLLESVSKLFASECKFTSDLYRILGNSTYILQFLIIIQLVILFWRNLSTYSYIKIMPVVCEITFESWDNILSGHGKVCMDIRGTTWTLYYVLINNEQFSSSFCFQFTKASPRHISIQI